MTVPASPIPLPSEAESVRDHLRTAGTAPSANLLASLAAVCPVDTGAVTLAEHGRDWWPLALHWALEGEVPRRPAAVVRPGCADDVSEVLAFCGTEGVPVTPTAGRSGVCGGSVPVFGGVVLDCLGLVRPLRVDAESMLVEVGAGTFGPELEAELRRSHGLTVGHFPQSFALSTVGGWLACRGAGQYSTRYGKIEDVVAGLEVVLADGRQVKTGSMAGAGPRSAVGPDLTQMFVGSEGTLGVIVGAELRCRPLPALTSKLAYRFPGFAEGIEALRRTLRRGATPAVLRLYDPAESKRLFGLDGAGVLVALDEGDPAVVHAATGILDEECARAGEALESDLVDHWLAERNDVSALGALTRAGIVVDTVEVSARWSVIADLYRDTIAELGRLDGLLAASAHESHAYPDGACLYFTFAGRRPEGADDGSPAALTSWNEHFYRSAWSAVMRTVLRHGASISHHHGIGLVRGQFVREALGAGYDVLSSLKSLLDPKGILNPGKLGLASPYGGTGWPEEEP